MEKLMISPYGNLHNDRDLEECSRRGCISIIDYFYQDSFKEKNNSEEKRIIKERISNLEKLQNLWYFYKTKAEEELREANKNIQSYEHQILDLKEKFNAI